ncbi:hypothetical protein [Silanimonas lenta]|uniref:hypothetical protein n=1 Tax=Silanimonas lenta TaxID=265429 RepID=UPI0012EB760D|nr:hypothetical protein [Silanimonas lenta]
MELRGATGVGVLVLEDGTLISLDFATGEVVLRPASGADIRVHRDQLPAAAREQFIHLASRAADNPGFSFEAGTSAPPYASASPVVVPRWGYPLKESMFAFGGRYFPKSGEDEEESPCAENPASCRPPVLLERIQVTGFSIDGVSSSDRFDEWWARTSDPRPVLSPSDMRSLFDQWHLEQDRSQWEQWRQRQCASVHSHVAASATATAAFATTCVFLWTPAGAIGCAASAVALILAMSQQASVTAACAGSYPGPGGWP